MGKCAFPIPVKRYSGTMVANAAGDIAMEQSNDPRAPEGMRQWVGRQERRTDWITPNHLAAWNATLDRDDAFPRDGDAVPPGFHWTLFPPLVRQSELGPDGHPKKGGFLPPVQLPRRMWAGGQLRFQQPLRVGDQVERESTIESVEDYPGLIVHGPLLATLLLDLLRRELPQASLDRFSFKALRSTYDTGPFSIHGNPGTDGRHFRLWSTDNHGQTAMEADAWIR